MSDSPTINIIMATDAKGLAPNATVLNSLRRHNPGLIHVRIFVRDLPALTCQVGNMKIEFIITPEELRLEGLCPEHVSAGPTYDRMAAMQYCDDWDRALVLDYDQLVISDISELFRMDMGDALVAGRIYRYSLKDAIREWFGTKLPYIFKHCEDYKFFMFGPLMNLEAMRNADTYEKYLYFNRVAKANEQIALHIACEDKVLGIADAYNIVPRWNGFQDDVKIYHFAGPIKPWESERPEEMEWWGEYQISWSDLTKGVVKQP